MEFLMILSLFVAVALVLVVHAFSSPPASRVPARVRAGRGPDPQASR
jgi:hypothetical protein